MAACESSPPPPPPSCRPIHSQSDTTSLRPLHLHDLSRLRCASETSSTTVGFCAWISPLVGKFCLPTTTYNIVLLNFLHIHSSHPTILCQPHRCTAQHNTALHDTVLVPRYNYQPRYTLSQAYFIVPAPASLTLFSRSEFFVQVLSGNSIYLFLSSITIHFPTLQTVFLFTASQQSQPDQPLGSPNNNTNSHNSKQLC